jgi:pyridoxamine 5'-phosphate oxidase family protein
MTTQPAVARSFTEDELAYLSAQRLGRLATAAPDGTLQASPVGFRYNPDLDTIDIGGFVMSRSRKFRNVAATGQVAFVVDDIASTDPWRVRFLEIRGEAEAVPAPPETPEGTDGALIRVRPRRVISFGLEPSNLPVHEQEMNARNVRR